jgi:hypothetical protein
MANQSANSAFSGREKRDSRRMTYLNSGVDEAGRAMGCVSDTSWRPNADTATAGRG